MGRSKLPIFAIAEKLTPPGKYHPELEFSENKFPSLKGLVLENTYRFNNILLCEYLTPIYNAAKAACTFSRPISALVNQGIVNEVHPVASNSESLLIRFDLRRRDNPNAYVRIFHSFSFNLIFGPSLVPNVFPLVPSPYPSLLW